MSPTLGELATAVLQKKYEKPTTGIPLNDLEDNALDDYATKADTVLTTTLSRGRKENTTVGTGSFAFGDNIEASQIYSHAEGAYTIASGNASHAEGTGTTATHQGSHAEGGGTTASNLMAHAEGSLTTASGDSSHAEGKSSIASGNYSHAEGVSTTASGNYSHAEGNRTVASGHNSHAEGLYAIASGLAAHAEGYYTEAQRFSHVGGAFNIVDSYDSWPEWSANTSYSVGDKVKITTVSDNVTTVTGYKCKTANSDASFTAANWINQYGQMNYAEIIGNGTSDARSNARALDWDGNEHLMGDVYVGCNADSSGGIKLARLGDVQINGTSIVNDGVANIPYATSNRYGVIKIGEGLTVGATGIVYTDRASVTEEKTGTNQYKPIVPNTQHAATFYGLSKAAGVDLASATVTVGTYPETSKSAIRTMLGATSSNVIAVQDEQPTDSDTKIWLPETAETPVEVPTVAEMNAALAGKVGDVQVNGTSIVSNGVANIPVAGSHSYGAIKVNSYYGIRLVSWSSDGTNDSLAIYAAEDSHVKAGVADYRPLTPNRQHMAAFYGLAKAAGDTTQASSANAVGTYTDDAKAAIQTMLGVPGDVQINGTSIVSNGVANIPVANSTTFGVIKIRTDGSFGLAKNSSEELYISYAGPINIKAGTDYYKPITSINAYAAAFYGLAKAAGDATQSASANAIGTYTSEAKAAIHTMLGIDPAAIAAQVDIPLVETVSGTTPTITGQPNTRYVCGEVTTISITPPSAGSVDVIFDSGSTAAVLTVPNTVRWPAWFDATALEADTTYEILITDGVYGSVMTWAN